MAQTAGRPPHLEPWIDYAMIGTWPREIVLRFEEKIVIVQNYADEVPEGTVGLTKWDEHGYRLVEVPVAGVDRWLTEDEADTVARITEIDQELLGYALG